MRFLSVLLFVVASVQAHADSRPRISDTKSDYLCYYVDSNGHQDEGYVISQLAGGEVEVRFVEEPYVKYPLNCKLDTRINNDDTLALQCKFFQAPNIAMSLEINKQTLMADVEITGSHDHNGTYKMQCRTNRE